MRPTTDRPSPFHLYGQTLEATFSTEADARSASLAFRDLPPGMEMSVSSRWDDSNPRHLANARAVTAAGAKATYYLNAVSPEFVDDTVRPVLAMGCSVGAHTKSHPHLPLLDANGIFDEILGNRIAIEDATDSPVSAFTLPFCRYEFRANPFAREAIGEALRRAGLLGGGDVLENPAATYGLPADSFVGCIHHGFDDHAPSRALFEERMDQAEERFRSGDLPACGPHVAMGTHSWATDEGMDEITRCFETRTRNPAAPYAGRTWFCNENEFIAAWMQARHTRIAQTTISGTTVRWALLRPEPGDVGDDVPLFVQFGQAPVAASVDGVPLEVSDSAQAALPNAPGHALPSRIGLLPSPDGSDPADSPKFPGILARLDVGANTGGLRLELHNRTAEALRGTRLSFRVPLAYEAIPAVQEIGDIPPGESRVFDLTLTRLHGDAWHNDGPVLIDAQLDFAHGDTTGRLHVTWSQTRPCTRLPGSLRDCLRIAPALPSILWTPEKLAGLSRPGASVEGLRLFPVDGPGRYAPCSYQLNPTSPDPMAIVNAVPASARNGRLYVAVVEFDAHGRDATLMLCGYGRFFLNGREVEARDGAKVPTLAGRNRVVLAQTIDFWYQRGALAILEDGETKPVTFRVAG